MVYAYDRAIPLPVKDLYDTQIMSMAIGAAKDMYDRGQKQIEDFYNKYGDFISPIQKDMDWYAQNVTGKARDVINNLYANGIDPLRSAEGRAAVAQIIRSMPIGDIAKVRQSAETAKEYLRSFDDDTNPELEKFLGRDLSKWSTLGEDGKPGNGLWKANKASKYQTIDDLIEPIVKNVDYSYDEALTKQHNDGNNYYSITHDRLMKAVDDNMSDILATPSGAFHWEQAKKAAAAQGGGEAEAKTIFKNMIGNRLSDHEKVKFEADPFRLDDYRTRNDIRAHSANKAIDHYYWSLEQGDGSQKKIHNIFREAEANAKAMAKQSKKGYTNEVAPHVQYERGEQYYQWIDPVVQAGMSVAKNKATGEETFMWEFNGKDLTQSGSINHLGTDGKMYRSRIPEGGSSGKYTFIPDGNMRARLKGKDASGREVYDYYVSGQLRGPQGNVIQNTRGSSNVADDESTVWIKVKERAYNYGQTQKSQ